jgi:hypothetical protein
MKRPNGFLKLAALVSSILLVGGFVAYQAGAVDWIIRGPSPLHEQANDTTSEESQSGVATTMMSGSKSFTPSSFVTDVDTSTPAQQPEKSTEEPKGSFLPGSKAPITSGRSK